MKNKKECRGEPGGQEHDQGQKRREEKEEGKKRQERWRRDRGKYK